MTESSAKDSNLDFFSVLDSFWQSMDAILESATFASQNGQELDDPFAAVATIAGRFLPNATEEQRRASTAVFKEILQRPHDRGLDKQADTDLEDESETVSSVEYGDFEEVVNHFSETYPNPKAFLYFLNAFSQAATRTKRLPIIFTSLLTSAVGAFEVLVAGTITGFLLVKPEALRGDDEKYSLQEIEGFETIEEFRRYCVDKYTEGVLRRGFDDWMKWFEKNLKVKLDEIVPDVSKTREIFQRRHLFVHNGGVVNRPYLIKQPELVAPPEIGQKLTADIEYLLEAIDILTSVGILLTAKVTRDLSSSIDTKKKIDRYVSDKAYECLSQGRFRVTRWLTDAIYGGCIDDDLKMVVHVNGWIARKKLFGVDEIRSEVEAWQTSPLEQKYKLAKFALLDLVEEAAKLGAKLINDDQLSQDDWDTWPLLSEVRDYLREGETSSIQTSISNEIPLAE